MNNKQPLALAIFLPLFCNGPRAFETSCAIDSLFVAEHTTDTYSMYREI